jgi:hypothetical protein
VHESFMNSKNAIIMIDCEGVLAPNNKQPNHQVIEALDALSKIT